MDHKDERMLVELAESGCPIFRFTSPLSRGRLKGKDHGNLSIHYSADLETIETYRIIVSVKLLSLYEAVAEMHEYYETFHDRSGEPVVKGESMSSLVRSVIKTEMLLDCDDLANITTRQIKLIFWDAVSLNFVEIGQYFITKDTADSSHLCSDMSCRHSFKRWRVTTIQRMDPLETPKLGPYWKLQHVICMVQNELRTELSLWAETILTRGLEFLMDQMKFLMDFKNNDPEITEYQLEAQALQLDAKDFVSRSKAKNNPQSREHLRK